jgi:hypothetical protein
MWAPRGRIPEHGTLAPMTHPAAGLVVLAGLLLAIRVVPASEPARPPASVTPRQLAEAAFDQGIRPLLSAYCVRCHGGDKAKGDLNLDLYRRGSAAVGARPVWKRVLVELRHGTMPPDEEKQPSEEERQGLATWIASLRRLDPPDPGRVTVRRLNRAEYSHTIRDLLGVDGDPGTDLPADDVGNGFDNIAEVLSLSPLLMEKYLLAADAVLDKVIVDDQLRVALAASEMPAVIDGKPDPGRPLPRPEARGDGKGDGKDLKSARVRILTTPGEVYTAISAPKEGRYQIRVRAGAEQAGKEPVRLAVKVDNQVVSEITVLASARSPSPYACTVVLPAGARRVSVIFINPYSEPLEEAAADPGKGPATVAAKPKDAAKGAKLRQRTAVIDGIEVVGPPASPPSDLHRRLVVAVPGKDLTPRDAARQVAERFAARAFRKPPTSGQLERLLTVFDLADSQGEVYSESIKLMAKAALISPEFCFRIEDDLPAGPDGVQSVGAYDLASRLSYFLWSTMPDEELMALARDGTLRDPAVIEKQVMRMVDDGKARALVDNFAGQWLLLRKILEATPDPKQFPEFTKELQQALYDEGAGMFSAVLKGHGSVLDFLDSDWAMLNERLAKFYGISGVSGPQLRKVALSDRNRGGVVGLGALLTVTSHTAHTSPVKRGKWVLEELLGDPPPSPPAMVPPLDEQRKKAAGASLTLRQLMERHRSDPDCASCHRTMDAIGFGLENYDPIGRWREHDEGGAIDAAGELPGHRRFDGPAQLKRLLMGRKDDFVRVLAAKLLTYALGRRVADGDDLALDAVCAAVAKDGYRLDRMIIEICRSYPFLYRRAAP